MGQWIRLTLFAVVLWAGAFGISVLVADWRQETDDLDALADDIADLKTDVAAIRSQVGLIPPEEPTAAPTSEEVVAAAEVGAVAEWRGMRLTIDQIKQSENDLGQTSVNLVFIVENIDASPELKGPFTAVDVEGFNCDVITGFLPAVQPGEKVRSPIDFSCQAQPKTLTVDGIRFEFP